MGGWISVAISLVPSLSPSLLRAYNSSSQRCTCTRRTGTCQYNALCQCNAPTVCVHRSYVVLAYYPRMPIKQKENLKRLLKVRTGSCWNNYVFTALYAEAKRLSSAGSQRSSLAGKASNGNTQEKEVVQVSGKDLHVHTCT